MNDSESAALATALREDAGAVVVECNAPLSTMTTFGIGGPADVLVRARSEAAVVSTLRMARDRGVPLFVIGGGSNLLVSDRGVRGIVLALDGDLKTLNVDDETGTVDVGAACSFPKLTRAAINRGWTSAVGWMGTPGQLGGALRMNAGSKDGEISDVVIEVRAASADHITTLRRQDCHFEYRRSEFPDGYVLTRALLQCDIRRIEDAMSVDTRARASLSRRHRTQPKLRSAGSIFKNPPGDFAGRLIQEAGMKGQQQGRAQISDIHANFVVNLGGALADDVNGLAMRAHARVKELFGVDLEWEVKRVGDWR